jgi:hypothetical protein
MFRWTALIVAVFAANWAQGTVQAAPSILVQRNFTAGDRALVFDPVTGLEWLRLTSTHRVPATDVFRALRPGATYFGWRFASPAEVSTMLTHAGLTSVFSGKAEFANSGPAATLMAGLGSWQFDDSPFPGGGARRSRHSNQWVLAGFTDDFATYPNQAGPTAARVRFGGRGRGEKLAFSVCLLLLLLLLLFVSALVC